MATNTFQNTQKILDEVMRLTQNNLVLANQVNTQFDGDFARAINMLWLGLEGGFVIVPILMLVVVAHLLMRGARLGINVA